MLLLTIRRSLALPMLFALLALPTPAVPPEDVLKPFADKLDKPIRVQFEQTPILRVLEVIQGETALPMFLDLSNLNEAHLQTTPFTFKGEITARRLFPLISQIVALDYDVRDGMLFFTIPAEALRPYLVTRSYNIADLVTTVPSFTTAPTMGRAFSSGNVYVYDRDDDGTTDAPRALVSALVAGLKQVVEERLHASQEARESGCSVHAVDANLVAMATPELQRQIVELLDQLEAPNARQVAIEARWIRIRTASLDRILTTHGPAGLFDPNAADKVLTALNQTEDVVTLAVTRQLSFSGQRTWIAAGRSDGYISDLTPVVADNVSAFDPTIDQSLIGATMDIVPTINRSNTAVLLTVRAHLAGSSGQVLRISPFLNFATGTPGEIVRAMLGQRPKAPEPDPSAPAAPQSEPGNQPPDGSPAVNVAGAVEHIDMQEWAVRTSVRIPVGGAALLSAGSQHAGPLTPPGTELVLFLRTRLP